MAKQSIWQRIRAFWRGVTGSGVATYDDPSATGSNDERDQQPGADIGMRNQLRSTNPPF